MMTSMPKAVRDGQATSYEARDYRSPRRSRTKCQDSPPDQLQLEIKKS